MTRHRENPAVRRAARVVALTPALFVTTATGAAFAEAPAQWENSGDVSPLHAIVLLGLIPAGLFLLIWLLVYLPSMARGQSYQPGQAWRNEPEWFGGPRGGVEAVDQVERPAVGTGEGAEEPAGQGGASGRW